MGWSLLDTADTVIVPGFRSLLDPPPGTLEALRCAAARGVRVASVCVGAFALAGAGVLNDRIATRTGRKPTRFGGVSHVYG